MEVLFKSVRLRYLSNVGKGGFIIGGRLEMEPSTKQWAGRLCKVIATEHRIQAGAQAYREVVFWVKMIWSDSKIVKSNLRLRFRQPQQPGFKCEVCWRCYGIYDAEGDSCTRHQLVDNSLSLLNCKALLLSVATSCIMLALVAFEKRETPDKTRVS
jgi:hypothetical protein